MTERVISELYYNLVWSDSRDISPTVSHICIYWHLIYNDKIVSLVLFSIHNLLQKNFGMMLLIPHHIILFWKQKDSSPVQEIGDLSNISSMLH